MVDKDNSWTKIYDHVEPIMGVIAVKFWGKEIYFTKGETFCIATVLEGNKHGVHSSEISKTKGSARVLVNKVNKKLEDQRPIGEPPLRIISVRRRFKFVMLENNPL